MRLNPFKCPPPAKKYGLLKTLAIGFAALMVLDNIPAMIRYAKIESM